ncbi:MAG TPA: T9SS type A sorting domain-containing protein [Bacteroidota bacterium]
MRSLPTLLLPVLFFCFAPSNAAFSQSWTSLNGPEGGVMQCFARDQNNHIAVGTFFGGVFKSTDVGLSWMRLSGGSWDTRSIAVNMATGDMFIGTVAGIYRSTDGGVTWMKLSNTLSNRLIYGLAVNSIGEVFAGSSGGFGQVAYRSTDNGDNFQVISAVGSQVVYGIVNGGSNTLFAASRAAGVFRSTDNGVTWAAVNLGSAFPVEQYGVAKGSGDNVYVVAGPSFTTVDSTITSGGYTLRSISASGQNVVAAGGAVAQLSTDAGATWMDASPLLDGVPTEVNTITTVIDNNTILLGTSGHSPLRSADLGQLWNQSSIGFVATHVIRGVVDDQQRIIISTQFDGVHTWDGAAWQAESGTLPPDDYVARLGIDEIQVVRAGTTRNGLWQSTNSGGTFSQTLFDASLGEGFGGIVSIPTKTYAGAKGGNIWRLDVGGSWQQWGSIGLNNVIDMGHRESGGTDYWYAAGGRFPGSTTIGQNLWEAVDTSQTWSDLGPFSPRETFTSLAVNADYIYGPTETNEIYERPFATSNWNVTPSVGPNITSRYVGLYEVGAETYAFVGTSDGIATREAGTSNNWGLLASLPQGIKEISWGHVKIVSTDAEYTVGSYGGGVFVGSVPTSVDSRQELPSASALFQNYPNPFNPSTKIGFRIGDRGFVSLKVYDLLGREVATLVNQEKSPGSYDVIFKESGLSSGVYFYRLQAGSFTQTKRFMLVK